MPIRLPYVGTPLMLAASLGSDEAMAKLSPSAPSQLDNAFEILLSCCDIESVREKFAPPRLWPYTLEAAMRMAVAVYREFLPDWHMCFQKTAADIPQHIPESFAPELCSLVSRWVSRPSRFSWVDAAEKYDWIKQDICLDGYLEIKYPRTPKVVSCYCLSALHLVSVEPESGPAVPEYDPLGRYTAGTSWVVGWFVMDGVSVQRMRDAINRELIPWSLAKGDPCDC
jgi:hypothetical protein